MVAIDNILSCGCILLLGVFFRICALFVRFFAAANLSATQEKKQKSLAIPRITRLFHGTP
jgi:hypothetical protein